MAKIHNPAIVVGVDRSDHSLAAVDLAIMEARARQVPLLLLTAHPHEERTGPHTTLTALLRRVCSSWPGLAATARNVTGDPAETLIDASRHATLLVVGRRPGNGSRPAGSMTARVAAHSFCPTIVAPADAPGAPEAPVMLGLGMSPADEPAIGFAFEEAALREVPLRAVHVWCGVPAPAIGAISPFSYDLRQAQQTADQLVTDALEPWTNKHPGVKVEQMALYDPNPTRTLLDASHLAGLLVVGSHRPDLHGSLLLGVTARTLLQRATRPVAVLRPSHRA